MGLLGGLFGKGTRVQLIQNSTSTVIQLDCSLKENHARESTPTKFPVEDGTSVSDHLILSPFDLDITGLITDTPIGGTQQLLTEVATSAAASLIPPVGVVAASGAFALFKALSNSSSPSVAAYVQLLQLQANKQPFDVLTSLYRYPNMWIAGLSAPRDAETGKTLMFTMKLTQLILVSPQSVNVQVFANPALSANEGDNGQQGLNLSKQYQAGFNSAHGAVTGVAPGGVAGAP
jgi:hypothetical protein